MMRSPREQHAALRCEEMTHKNLANGNRTNSYRGSGVSGEIEGENFAQFKTNSLFSGSDGREERNKLFHTRYQQCGRLPGARAGGFNPADGRTSAEYFQNKKCQKKILYNIMNIFQNKYFLIKKHNVCLNSKTEKVEKDLKLVSHGFEKNKQLITVENTVKPRILGLLCLYLGTLIMLP